MLALFDFLPKFCPNCGREIELLRDKTDYQSFCSFTCNKCRMLYQRAEMEHIVKAAMDSGGDLKFYYNEKRF